MRAIQLLRHVLADLPGARSSLPRRGQGDEVLMEVRLGKTRLAEPLALHWLSEGWPADVRQLAERIPSPWPRHVIVAAPALSPGAIEMLRDRDANWMDERGNVRIIVPPGLALIKTAPANEDRHVSAFSWSRSSATIAEILLNEPATEHRLRELESRTRWSAPQISNVLAAFDAAHWTERHGPARGAGVFRRVANAGSMLEAWTAHLSANRPARRLGHRVMRDPMQFLQTELASALGSRTSWAVTGWAGLALVAPFLTATPSLHVYLGHDDFGRAADAVFAAAKIRAVNDGANIEIWQMDGPIIPHSQTVGPVSIINAPRLYADLVTLGGRGEEAAGHLRETTLGY